MVSPDRPSYGGSSPDRGRSIESWPADVKALADVLNIDRFMVAGHSSGGPYALACAALLPERVAASVILGGVTDTAWHKAGEGYPATEWELMQMADEDAVKDWCVTHFGSDGSRFLAASNILFPEPDERLYEDATIAPLLAAARAEAFRQGVSGYVQDVFLQGRPWTFDPKSITAPTHILHGELDTIVPLAHSKHTSELVPGSTLRVLRGHGHFTILAELPTLASALWRSVGQE